jgi:hypothetical protein
MHCNLCPVITNTHISQWTRPNQLRILLRVVRSNVSTDSMVRSMRIVGMKRQIGITSAKPYNYIKTGQEVQKSVAVTYRYCN